MKTLVFFLFLLPGVLWAQDNGDSVKYEMIKSTVHFCATDTTFKFVKEHISNCKFPDYGCLATFCDSNKLTGLSARINQWSICKTNSKSLLQQLEKMISNDITDGDKKYRRHLPAYKEYNDKMASAMNSYRSPGPPPGSGEERSGNSMLVWLSLFIGFLGLALSVWIFLNRSTPGPQKTTAVLTDHEIIAKLETDISGIRRQLLTKADESVLNELGERIKKMETAKEQQPAQPSNIPLTPAKPEVEQKQAASPTILFAKIPDLPSGFSDNVLKKEQNGEQAYEISIRENRAVFRISENQAAQGYVLNDLNYILEKACIFGNQPFSGCRIVTIKEGSLTRSADGWMIENKAMVEFR